MKTEETLRQETDLVPYEDKRYKKSNILIGAKFKSSLLENKIFAYSLWKIDDAVEIPGGNLISKISAKELKKELGTNSGSFYRELDKVARSMTGREIGISDPEKERFEYHAVVTSAIYENGILTIEYNRHLKKYLKDPDTYALLDYNITRQFKSVHSFKLYELLRSKTYYPKSVKADNYVFKIDYSIAELKVYLGVVNANLDSVKRVLNGSPTPDYEKAVKVAEERTMDRWCDFKACVIDKAIAEINEKTSMHIEYETQMSGRGRKVHGITFLVTLQTNDKDTEEHKVMSQKQKEMFLDDIQDVIPAILKITEYTRIAEASDYDIERIKKAVSVMQAQKNKVENVAGYLISAIKENYELPTTTETVTKKKSSNHMANRNKFHNFHQREYDYEELEKRLLNTQETH